MAGPHPIELFVPIAVLGAVGFFLFGNLGGELGAIVGATFGVVVGAAVGSSASVADESEDAESE
ncbi:hypothetical protein [Halorussus salinus]|uniref:hypothetical protein n=1 Tax=Halorussus salinus TaxID=1364935 RepID=UPI0010924208|nr:hypothetical protein [Halorussus salinus]